MPSDIRSFFGGGGGGAPKAVAKAGTTKTGTKDTNGNKANSNQRARPRKVVSDDDDDPEVLEVKPNKPSTPKAKKVAKEVVEEETTSSAYFASSKPKPSKSTPIRSKPVTINGSVNGGTPSSERRSSRRAATQSYAEDNDDEEHGPTVTLKEDPEGGDDIFSDMKSRKVDDDYNEGTDEEEMIPHKKATKAANGPNKKSKSGDEDEDLEMAQISAYDGAGDARRKTAARGTAGRKRKSKDLDEDGDDNFLDDDDDDAPKKKSRKTATTTPKKPRATTKKEEKEDSKELQDIYANIPTVRAPTPPPRDENKKFVYGGGNANATPTGGSAELPVGADNCLAGLTFVFTGVLNQLGREEGQNLVKQYGGKVTTAPSKKTSYVVLGSDAGPKKLEIIHSLGIKTINEEGLFALIQQLPANGGDGKAGEAYAQKQAKEEEKIRKQAEDEADRERGRQKAAAKVAQSAAARPSASAASAKKVTRNEDKLWVDRYAPDAISSVCGNKGQVEGLQRWLRNWPKSARANFKHGGADGKGTFRAALLHGPPGVGKTTAAHLIAKLEGYDVVESNASETRNKRLLETSLRGVLDTTSLNGYFAADGKKLDASKRKLLLIMDEVDGMSAGDRGGVGALAAVAKKSNIPLIMICNDRGSQKMKPLVHVTAEFKFIKPTTDMIRGRIATILYREGMKLPLQIINALIEGCNGDIRQIINMISTVKLDNKDLDFSDSRALTKAWEKHVILKPWDIVNKILRAQMFSATSTATLNDKTELYFNDHEKSYLLLQENYLKTQPSLTGNYKGKERDMKLLELIDNAASSISDGDLVDRMIHGSQQHWSLMPTHAIFSFVRPASYVYGNMSSGSGFPAWFGHNSKQSKLSRFVKEVQGHMRLRTSADRHEIRQQYLPALWSNTVGLLKNEGKEAVQDVIDFMDSYYLTKDDFDAILELGVGEIEMETIKIESAIKAQFTRLYNAQSHPMSFVKASSSMGLSKAGGAKREKPDLEEAVDESEGEEALADADAGDEDDELDLKKDKYIKAPKKKAAAGAGAKGKGKRKKADDEESEADSDEEPKKKRGGASSGRGRGRGGGRGRGRGKA